MMRILILGDINSAHIKKWCLGLASKGIKIGIYSLSFPKEDWYNKESIHLFSSSKPNDQNLLLRKLAYYRHPKLLKEIIFSFKPDIVHAHYASSYGMLARYSGFHPYVVSVWGSDIFDFPKKNFITSSIIRKNLKFASAILATGIAIKNETEKYTDKNVLIIPFGIDMNLFSPNQIEPKSEQFTIGIVKSMEEIYGIDLLIHSFFNLTQTNNNLRLLIVGNGTKLASYKLLVKEMGIDNLVQFTGKKHGIELKTAINSMDICVFPSRMESFGVAQLEASACGKPVISTRVGGVSEVVENNSTGILIEKPEVELLTEAIQKLICSPELRKKMGERGRIFVTEKYELNNCLNQMIKIYNQLLS
jgi:glycosyltransferase involved in cell wall biosynthesis